MLTVCDFCSELILENEIYFCVNIATYSKKSGQNTLVLPEKTDKEEKNVVLFNLKKATEEELNNSVHKHKKFDLCKTCYQKFFEDPFFNY
ncbi:hypothetical protein IT568_00405 [bacterium]|nr:hypothetical protein [bacterium]